MIVKIKLTNGSCQTLFSTIETLVNIPMPDENNEIYIGRSKEAFSAILRHLRGEALLAFHDYTEDFVIHGLAAKEDEIGSIAHINVGGTIFSAREKVLATMSYFKSWFDWNTACDTFIDRTPEDFATFLHIVESRYHDKGYDQVPDESQATFFGYEFVRKDLPDPIIITFPIKSLLKTTSSNSHSAALINLAAYGALNAHTHSNDFCNRSIFLQQPLRKHMYSFQYNTLLMTKHGVNTFKVTFPRCCDLIGNTHIYIDLEYEPTHDEVFNCINMVKLEIGGQQFDTMSGDAMRVFANSIKYKIEIRESRVAIPLAMFFQNNPHLFIPLVALTRHEVEIIVVLKHGHCATHVALMYQAIFLDGDERRHFSTRNLDRIICVTQEQEFTNIVVDSNHLQIFSLDLDGRIFKHVLQDLYIYLKPHLKTTKEREPLHKIMIQYNNTATLEFDPILTRHIIPRESYGINDNHELIYYVPMDNTCNLSRFDSVKIKLAFAIEGTYDVVVICRVNNVMRMAGGMTGLAFA